MTDLLDVPPCLRPVKTSADPIDPILERSRKVTPRKFKLRGPQLRRAVFSVAACSAAYVFIGSGVHPYVEAHRLTQQEAAARKQIIREQERQQDLQRQVAVLQTPQGEQNAARLYGWVLKGEVPIACPVKPVALTSKSDAELLSLPKPQPPGFFERTAHTLEW